MPADVPIVSSSVESVPKDYTIPQAQEIILKAASASFDGTTAAADYFPCLQLVAPNNRVMFTAALSAPVAAGVSADVSWFPWWRGLAGGGAPPPTPFGNIIAWYDYSDASTITLDGSGNIQTILDKSGNGHTATQSTAARRPGQTTVNGLKAGLFASANTTCLKTATFAASYTDPLAIAIVCSQTATGGVSYWPGFFAGRDGDNYAHLYVHHTDNTVILQVGGGAVIATGAIVPFVPFQFIAGVNGGSSALVVNGSVIGGNLTASKFSQVIMGAQFDGQLVPGEIDFMDGAICEYMAISGSLTAGQLSGLESYLKTKWGTP